MMCEQKYKHDEEDKEFIDKLKKLLRENLSVRVQFSGSNNYGCISNKLKVDLLYEDEIISSDIGYIDLATGD